MVTSISVQIKQAILEAAKAAFPEIELQLADIELEHPAVEEHGDYSTNIALKLKGSNEKSAVDNPGEIAEKIVACLQPETGLHPGEGAGMGQKLWGRIEISGPARLDSIESKQGFINFWLAKEVLVGEIREIGDMGEKYGGSETGAGKTVVIDYSAPNIAKRFGIGHLRSTIIGQAIYNLYKFSGYKTVGDNHLGDWGTQFGSILAEIQSRHQRDKMQSLTIDDLEKLYVDFNRKAEIEPELKNQAREWFKKLEEGDAAARELWNQCVEISLAEFDRIYDLLGVKIDYAYGESFYESLMLEVIGEAKVKKIAKQSDGAWVIEISGQKTPLLLVKSDGTTTYATRDLATLKFRQKEWNPDMVIYEVGAEQALHFIQVFAAARMLGYVKDTTQLVHTKHGLYRWEHGKMKTRSGDTIKLEEILNEAVSRARKLGSKDEKTARAVGIGAVKYFDLKHNVQSDIVFDWEKMFALEGDSGPYLQYTYARARSVIRKSENSDDQKTQIIRRSEKSDNSDKSDSSDLSGSLSSPISLEEMAILRYIYRFPEVVELAAWTCSPNLVCNYLFELARRFNNFYNEIPILQGDQGNRGFRLAMTAATAQVLKNGLNLLGIEALERM